MKESNNLKIIYRNELNTVTFKDFNATEIDLLFTILSKLRNAGKDEITLSFEILKKLSKYSKSNAISYFVSDLEKTYDKLIKLDVKIGTSKKWTKFIFFTKYEVDEEKQEVTIAVNSEFSYLINEITGFYTELELNEITSLKSTYSKTMYRLLKQYRASGWAKFKLDEFRELLDIPESYLMGNINQQVLKPIMRELPKFFKNLRIEKIKGNGKNKRRIVRLDFYFENDAKIDERGNRTFRKKTGEFYEKNIFDFEDEEILKAYPKDPN